MILFFGIRPGKQKSRPLVDVPCPHCDQRNTLNLYEQANLFHLFWIPLFKVGTSRFAECTHCKRVFYKEEFTEAMQELSNL